MYLAGTQFGLPPSCSVHPLSNLSGTLSAGENCRIDAFVTMTGRVKLGKDVHIATGACLFGSHGIEIGDGVSISPGAKIFSASEDTKSHYVSNPQLDQREYYCGSVTIKDYAVVGANSVVLPNVVIGKGAQIGCLSLVKHSVPDYEIRAGIPVKQVGIKTLEY
jgi:acetyltransferase-like isoleucine patch superfamily enzyme